MSEEQENQTPLALLLTLGIFLILIFGSGLFTMEKNFAMQSKALSELQENATVVKNISQIDATLDGKLVSAQGAARTNETLQDARFGIDVKGLGLAYNVSFYQDVDTGEAFEVDWISNPERYLDPQDYAINAHVLDSLDGNIAFVKDATLGAYRIDGKLLEGLHEAEPLELRVTPDQLQALHDAMLEVGTKALNVPDSIEAYQKAKAEGKNPRILAKIVDNELYLGFDPKKPQLGDMRVTFSVIPEQDVTVVANMQGDTLHAYKNPIGAVIPLIVGRKTSMDATIQEYLDKEKDNAWLLRILFTLFIMFGTRVLVAYKRRTATATGEETYMSSMNPWIPSFTLGLILATVIAFAGQLLA